MQSWFPFIPESASTVSSEVDALYFYISGVTVFFSLLIAGNQQREENGHTRDIEIQRIDLARDGRSTLRNKWKPGLHQLNHVSVPGAVATGSRITRAP